MLAKLTVREVINSFGSFGGTGKSGPVNEDHPGDRKGHFDLAPDSIKGFFIGFNQTRKLFIPFGRFPEHGLIFVYMLSYYLNFSLSGDGLCKFLVNNLFGISHNAVQQFFAGWNILDKTHALPG